MSLNIAEHFLSLKPQFPQEEQLDFCCEQFLPLNLLGELRKFILDCLFVLYFLYKKAKKMS